VLTRHQTAQASVRCRLLRDQRHVLRHLVVYLMALAFSFLVQRVPTYSSRGPIENLCVKVSYPPWGKVDGTVENIQVQQTEKQFFSPFECATADGVAVCHSVSLIHTAVIYVWRFTVLSSGAPCIGVYYNSVRLRCVSIAGLLAVESIDLAHCHHHLLHQRHWTKLSC
jgi:hypothetical protein